MSDERTKIIKQSLTKIQWKSHWPTMLWVLAVSNTRPYTNIKIKCAKRSKKKKFTKKSAPRNRTRDYRHGKGSDT